MFDIDDFETLKIAGIILIVLIAMIIMMVSGLENTLW